MEYIEMIMATFFIYYAPMVLLETLGDIVEDGGFVKWFIKCSGIDE